MRSTTAGTAAALADAPNAARQHRACMYIVCTQCGEGVGREDAVI